MFSPLVIRKSFLGPLLFAKTVDITTAGEGRGGGKEGMGEEETEFSYLMPRTQLRSCQDEEEEEEKKKRSR